ncbi:MAG: hypothetical protein IJU04_04255, partial [Ruminococcus sp.]|nr:hypothetical protein [Ruminococcus sp.]
MRFFHRKDYDEPLNEPEQFTLDYDAIERIDNEFPDNEYYPDEDEFYEPEIKPKHRLRKFIIILIILCLVITLVHVAVLFFTGKLWFNEPDKLDYPIRGAVINSDMGEILWDLFSKQNLSLAYIRATSGTA